MHRQGQGLRIFSDSYCRTATKVWYYFLYSLKNLTNGTKSTTESHIDAIYGLYKLVTRIYQTNEKNTTINLHLLDKFDI
jgi:hypothetical protein